MKNKHFTFLVATLFSLSACFGSNKGGTVKYQIEYNNESINKVNLDNYFLTHEEEYPSYKALKENVPNILDRTRTINISEGFTNKMQAIRFSNSENGFLGGETFLLHNGQYFHLGGAWGGHGVTEFIRRQGDRGYWLYFLYSNGSGIHRTNIGVYSMSKSELYTISSLELEINKDYTFKISENNTIDIYEATIEFYYDEGMFPHYTIVEKGLVIEAIDELQKVKI